jgi:hypothetical protein
VECRHDRRALPAHKPTRASPAHKTAQCDCLRKGHSAAPPKPSMPGRVYLWESNSSADPVGVLTSRVLNPLVVSTYAAGMLLSEPPTATLCPIPSFTYQ